MPKAHDIALREQVIEFLAEGHTLNEAAAHFEVGRASVNRWSSRFNKTGDIRPKSQGGRRRVKLDESDLKVLLELVAEKPDSTLAELVSKLRERTGRKVSRTTISRRLRNLKVTQKKKSLVASEQKTERVQALRAKFREWQVVQDFQRLVFVDEAGSTISMTPTHAWAPRGQRAVGHVPRNRGTVTTMIGALTIGGLEALMTIEGATDAAVFLAFVEKVLGPRLGPGDMVVMDNVGAHRDARIRHAVEAHGAKLVFLPPYSPDLNPIEECWSKVKHLLRSAAARSREALDQALARIVKLVTPMDAAGWIAHAGYRVEPV